MFLSLPLPASPPLDVVRYLPWQAHAKFSTAAYRAAMQGPKVAHLVKTLQVASHVLFTCGPRERALPNAYRRAQCTLCKSLHNLRLFVRRSLHV
jgi:hypothetical protein